MTPLFRQLQRLHDRGSSIRVGVIGSGFMARGLVYQLSQMAGMRASVIVARNTDRAVAAWRDAGTNPRDIVVTDEPTAFASAAWRGSPLVTTQIELAAEVSPVDVFVECTGAVEFGARAALACIGNRRHFVSLNAETDATVGCVLKHEADAAGVVYSNSDGDQPGVLMRLIEYCRACGFEVRAAINCKGYMDVRATPDSIMLWAQRQNTSPRMTTAFTDGTKLNIEMNVVCNASGLIPMRRGMTGVRTDLKNALADLSAAGVLSGSPTVAYTLGGDFGGGVFVVARGRDPDMVGSYLKYMKMGEGPDYLFYRPYHLCHFETPLSAAEAVLYREPTVAPMGAPVAQTVAIAKRPLRAGEMLDGMGGFTLYGEVDTAANAHGLLPAGLADGVRLVRDVPQDEPIPLDAVELDESRMAVRLWRRQLRMSAPATAKAA